jgi:predicted phosphodiesterase
MRIRILSDLHLEFGPLTLPQVDADVVVLAGDIHKKTHGVRWANDTFSMPVIYVLGNHEFYGDRIDRVLRDCRAAASAHVHVLEGDSVTIDGVRFLGSTLWTDFDLFGAQRRGLAMDECHRAMNDFKLIRVQVEERYPRFSPALAMKAHRRTRQWLTDRLAEGDVRRTVVVTHHAPHRGSLAPEYAHDLLSAAYVSELGDLLGAVPLWIHGHTHTSFDYRVGDTRVMCNPRGYVPTELNDTFAPDCVVEVG